MKKHSQLILALLLLSATIGCNGQSNKNSASRSAVYDDSKIVGGGCDGCEIMYVGMPNHINSVDTSDGWYESGQKLLVTGIVHKLDGKTPAPNVIIYYWQTDNNGYYSPKDGMDEQARRHGHITRLGENRIRRQVFYLYRKTGSLPEWKRSSAYSYLNKRA